MKPPDPQFLINYGWDSSFETEAPAFASGSIFPARVISEERSLYQVQYGMTEVIWAAVSGKMQFKGATRSDYPAVGDWVLIGVSDRPDRAVIYSICPRRTVIQRKQVGAGADMQIMSTNVDYVFVTTSMNEELNLRRLERYLTMASESGATPILLLTKADLQTEKVHEVTREVRKEFPDTQVHTLSNQEFEKADFFARYLIPGKCAIFVGSSGVGKSTLVNFLVGQNIAKTQEVRGGDDKGRHTTTARSLYMSRFGGLIIDTPGMRELQLSGHEEGVKIQFADIETLFTQCKFRDCLHKTEPGCAIKKALASGDLQEVRWNAYQKLVQEVLLGSAKKNQSAIAADRRAWKKKSNLASDKAQSRKSDDEGS